MIGNVNRGNMEETEIKWIFSGNYDEALDKQEQEKYLREETEAARSEGKLEGKQEGIEIGEKNGTKQNAIQTAKNLLKEVPDWSDQEVAELRKDLVNKFV